MARGLSGRAAATWSLPVVLALVVMGPVLLGRGFVLRGDLVFVPNQPWKPAWLGLDGGVPRAVPSDALTWLAGVLMPGDIVEKAVLVLILVLAGVGTARLVRDLVWIDGSGAETGVRAWLVTAAPVALVIWNPYVYERLSIGHWALLCGYAALPWVVHLAAGTRPFLVVVPVAVAAWTSPTGGLMAAAAGIAVLAVTQRRRIAGLASALVVLLNLPWIVPGVLAPHGTADAVRTGVEAFAARADTPWGTLGSLLSFGGLWKEAVDPPGRDDWLLSGAGLLLTGLGVAGIVMLARRATPGPTRRVPVVLGALALGGLLLAWLPTTGPGEDLFSWLGALPGGGLLRDSQKWVAPTVLATAVGLGEAARRWLPSGGHGTFWGAALVVLPVAAMPGLAWGLAGSLDTVSYPREWSEVRTVMAEAGAADERVVVLPFSVYRRFPWADGVAVLDPAPRFFPGDVVVDDALPVRDAVVPGESLVAARIRATEGSPDRLAAVLADEGIRFVLVERTTPGGADVASVTGEVLHDGEELTLVDLGEGSSRGLGMAARSAVVAGDVAALVALLIGVSLGLRQQGRDSRPRRRGRTGAE